MDTWAEVNRRRREGDIVVNEISVSVKQLATTTAKFDGGAYEPAVRVTAEDGDYNYVVFHCRPKDAPALGHRLVVSIESAKPETAAEPVFIGSQDGSMYVREDS